MKTTKSKIEGIGIVELRCEICYGNIEQNEPLTALLTDTGIHFVHTKCYNDNNADEIIKCMNNMKAKVKSDKELFDIVESCNENPNL